MAVWLQRSLDAILLSCCMVFVSLVGLSAVSAQAQSGEASFGIMPKIASKTYIRSWLMDQNIFQIGCNFLEEEDKKVRFNCKDGQADWSYKLTGGTGSQEFSNGHLINSDLFGFLYLNKDGNIIFSYEYKGYYTTVMFVPASDPAAATKSSNFSWYGSKKEFGRSATAKIHFDIIKANYAFFLGTRRGEMPVAVAIPDLSVIDPRLLPAGWDVGPSGKPPTGTASTAAPPKPSVQAVAGQAFRDCDTCPEMVVIPAGSFLMGSNAAEEGRNGDEGPVHNVTFARPFAVGKFEVTFDEWAACATAGGCPSAPVPTWAQGKRPVSGISWTDAQLYVAWLSKKTGHSYFLPAESEWEYAARAGTVTPWNTGDAIISDDANILNQFEQPVPVGGFPPNAFGLHDTHGNVLEWVLDCHDVGYFGAPADGSAVASNGCKNRVMRGGDFTRGPMQVRSAQRLARPPTTRAVNVGLRVARAM